METLQRAKGGIMSYITRPINIERTTQERVEIFTFPTEKDRQWFIAKLREHDPHYPYATNMDPEESEPERYLVAVPIDRYNFVMGKE